MKGTALILWKSEDKRRGAAIKVEVSGSTIADTMSALRVEVILALDRVSDEAAFGWYHIDMTIKRI